MEHLNRQLKTVITNMGSNIQTTSILNAAKSIGLIHKICSNLEKEIKGKEESGLHHVKSYKKDLQIVCNILEEEGVLKKIHGRSHSSYKFESTILEKFDFEATMSWLIETLGTFSYQN